MLLQNYKDYHLVLAGDSWCNYLGSSATTACILLASVCMCVVWCQLSSPPSYGYTGYKQLEKQILDCPCLI